MNHQNLIGTIVGQYELQKRLSRSEALVITYQGYQLTLKRSVAIQLLGDELQKFEENLQGFIRSAEIMASLEHPNITPIYDCGYQGKFPYIVTRLMEKGSLRARLEAGIMPLQSAASVIQQIGRALEYVHSRENVHGDPSPSNIVFDDGGSAYIANFHVAGLQNAINEAGGIVGTPLYTAPEKWVDGQATSASDQYALASIGYQMLTGYAPFSVDAPTTTPGLEARAILARHLYDMPPKLPTELPAALNDVFNRALAKKPEDRYPTVMDFAREFEKATAATPKHLFISYSRRDKDYAQGLTEHLQHNGFEVWIDSQIEYGDAWFRDIEQAVKNCAAFVLVMSPDSYESEWVQKEILLAKRYKKPIFPLLLRGEEFGIVIDIQFADVRDIQMPNVDFHRRLRRTVFGDV